MSFRKLLVTVSSLVLVTAGCSTGSTEKTINGLGYLVLESGDLTMDNDSIRGSGSIVFNTPLSSMDSNNHFKFGFTLEDGGSLTLVTNATNKLASGVALKFTRDGSSLKVSLETPEGTTDLSAAFNGHSAASALGYQIDIHNDEPKTHVLAWQSTETAPVEKNAFLNTEDAGLEAKGKGAGTFWGLVCSKASLAQIAIDKPKVVEEE